MDISIYCCDGSVICEREVILKHSNILREHFSYMCQCNSSIIIPDFKTAIVSQALTLLKRVQSEVELSKELSSNIGLLYSLLQIPWVLPNVEVLPSTEPGEIEVCFN